MATRTSLFVAPVAKSKARVSLKKHTTASIDTTSAPIDQSTPVAETTTATAGLPAPAPLETTASPANADMGNAPEGPMPSTATKKRKDKGLVVVDLSDEPLGKRVKASVIRS